MDSSVPKGGAGAYNWGSIDAEYDHENVATIDEADGDSEGAAGGKPLFPDV